MQSFLGILQIGALKGFAKIHKKKLILESFFNKPAATQFPILPVCDMIKNGTTEPLKESRLKKIKFILKCTEIIKLNNKPIKSSSLFEAC